MVVLPNLNQQDPELEAATKAGRRTAEVLFSA